MKILGIDPGLQRTGWGIILSEGSALRLVVHGLIKTQGADPMAQRLQTIYEEIENVVVSHKPDMAAIEETFVNNNPASSLKLGQARGAAMVALAGQGLEVAEYTPNLIKKSIVGAGHADKNQIILMVSMLLNCSKDISADEADALAVAITHAHHATHSEVAYSSSPKSSLRRQGSMAQLKQGSE